MSAGDSCSVCISAADIGLTWEMGVNRARVETLRWHLQGVAGARPLHRRQSRGDVPLLRRPVSFWDWAVSPCGADCTPGTRLDALSPAAGGVGSAAAVAVSPSAAMPLGLPAALDVACARPLQHSILARPAVCTPPGWPSRRESPPDVHPLARPPTPPTVGAPARSRFPPWVYSRPAVPPTIGSTVLPGTRHAPDPCRSSTEPLS